jgi:hypothetical protein
MPGVTRAHGYAGAVETVGRNLLVKSFAKGSAISQAEMDALVQNIQGLATIEVIGTFTAASTQTVYMILSGAEDSDFAAAATISAGGATFTIADVTGFVQ